MGDLCQQFYHVQTIILGHRRQTQQQELYGKLKFVTCYKWQSKGVTTNGVCNTYEVLYSTANDPQNGPQMILDRK